MPPTRRAKSPANARGATPPSNGPAARTRGKGKKDSLWAQYQSLTLRRPRAMNYGQSTLISVAGTLMSQALFQPSFNMGDVIKFVLLTVCVIVPVNTWWFKRLGSYKLHWVKAALVDQFIWSPFAMNIMVFWFLNTYDGGLSLATSAATGSMSLTLSLNYAKYASPLFYSPMWDMQLKAYCVWLPATLMREALIPPHLVPIFINVVGFIWNIVFALILRAA